MGNTEKRSYRSQKRTEQARETRRQILAAARDLFVVSGYSGTTVDAIARGAGVAPETVFAIFKNKRAILADVLEIAVGGDDQQIPLLQRDNPQQAIHEPDQRKQIHIFSTGITEIVSRVAPIFEIMKAAAKTEPEIDALVKGVYENRFRNIHQFVSSLEAHGPIRAGLDQNSATETAWALSSPDMYNLLTTARGWTKVQFASWLEDSLVHLLLP